MAPRVYENSVYSFGDCAWAIVGPGNLNASASGEADEGYSVEFEGDKDTMTPGAGGDVMHSLRVAQPGTITLRLLKASSFNKVLSDAYNYQTGSASTHAQNTITINDFARGDTFICQGSAFRKFPNVNFQVQGGTQEWVFNVSRITPNLGAGVDQILSATTGATA